MSGSDNLPPEFNPQHRVVGAVVLVVIAIIVVPMVLNEKRLTSQDAGNEITLSDEDAKVFVSRAEDIRKAQVEKKNPGEKKLTNSKKVDAAVKKSIIPPVTEKPVAEKKSEPAANKPAVTVSKTEKKTTKPKPSKKITKGWVVQIGTYSDPANAKKVRASLVRRGYHVRLEKIRLSKGSATRVRVGPFSDRGKAITTLSHIGRDVGLQGVVLKYP